MKVLTRVRAASQRARRESVRRRRWKREHARAVRRIGDMARAAADLTPLDLAAWREFAAPHERHFRVHLDGTFEEIPEPPPASVTGRVVEVTETSITIETEPCE